MSQVDYIHFFSNVVWSIILFVVIYVLICLFYVQNMYKVVRLRNVVLTNVFLISKNQVLSWLYLSKFLVKFYNNFKNYYNKFIVNFLQKRKNIVKLLCM